MATFRKRLGKWEVKVRRYSNKALSKAFLGKADADKWAREVEVDCTDGKAHKGELCTLPMSDPKGEIVRVINKAIPSKPESWAGIKKL